MQCSTSGHQRGHRRKRVVHPVQQRAQRAPSAAPPAAECLRGEELHLGKPLVILKSPLTPVAGTNAGSRQRQRDSAMFDITESITQLLDGHVPTRRT